MPRGRITRLTPEVQEKIVNALLAGNYYGVACRYAGISPTTGYEWLARGEGKHKDRQTNRLYAEFADAVRKAEADEEVGTVAILKKGLPDSPKTALDFLARRHPSRWGQRDTLTILKKLASDMDKMSDDELFAIADENPSPAVEAAGEDEAGAAGPSVSGGVSGSAGD